MSLVCRAGTPRGCGGRGAGKQSLISAGLVGLAFRKGGRMGAQQQVQAAAAAPVVHVVGCTPGCRPMQRRSRQGTSADAPSPPPPTARACPRPCSAWFVPCPALPPLLARCSTRACCASWIGERAPLRTQTTHAARGQGRPGAGGTVYAARGASHSAHVPCRQPSVPRHAWCPASAEHAGCRLKSQHGACLAYSIQGRGARTLTEAAAVGRCTALHAGTSAARRTHATSSQAAPKPGREGLTCCARRCALCSRARRMHACMHVVGACMGCRGRLHARLGKSLRIPRQPRTWGARGGGGRVGRSDVEALGTGAHAQHARGGVCVQQQRC